MSERKKSIFISDNKNETLLEIIRVLKQNDEYEVFVNNDDVNVDVTKIAAVKEYFDTLDNLHAVIIAPPSNHVISIEAASDEEWDRSFNEGALPAMLLTHAGGEYFKNHGGGKLIYMGTIHAEKPTGGDFLYSLQAGAVQMLCREAALAYGEYNVDSFYIQCGIMESDLERLDSISNIYSAPELRYPKKTIPTDDHLNGLIGFLLSPDSSPLSGSDLKADGGFTMYYGNRGDR